MKKLILITDYFPYSYQETFLENEIPYLANNFNLSIVSAETEKSQTRLVPDGVKVYRCTGKSGFSFSEKLKYVSQFFFSKDGLWEVYDILKSGNKILLRLLSSIYFFTQAQSYYKQLIDNKILNPNEEQIIYSYWSSYRLLGLTHNLKNTEKIKITTRLHGYDLYNERFNQTMRQPFKKQMEIRLKSVMLVAQSSKDYYLKNFCLDFSKVILMRLGTVNTDNVFYKLKDNVFTICSCSNIIPLKRVHLIAIALSKISSFPIKWVHFGDGNCLADIDRIVASMPSNIVVEIKGRVPNAKVIEFYCENNIDCFITTSETEGGNPVSIMEALSFGIPIIATKVGGIPEMLQDTLNVLISPNPSIDEIIQNIESIHFLNNSEKRSIHKENIRRWNEYYNAESNNLKLINHLNKF